MKCLFTICFLLLGYSVGMAQFDIQPDTAAQKQNIVYQTIIFEDAGHQYSAEEVLAFDLDSFKPIENANLDFTTSTYWIRFGIHNYTYQSKSWVAEIARPITNKCILYDIRRDRIRRKRISGDDYTFSQRNIEHRKNLFKLRFAPNEDREYLLQLESDGEMLAADIILWQDTALQKHNYWEQYILGLYYGVLFFVTLIYFFFYIRLREKSFLYYVAYVASIAGLQMSLDGLAFQYLFPSNSWLANHVVLLSAAATVMFVMLYSTYFMRLKERLPKLHRVFRISIIAMIVIAFLSLIPGVLYEICYPVINILSLLSIVSVAVSIPFVRRKGYKVDPFFSWAFILLIAGAVLFILRNLSILPNNDFTDHVLKLSSGIEIILLSFSMANRYREMQQEKEVAQEGLLKQLEETAELQKNINKRLEQEVKERTSEIELQKEQLSAKNKDILSSIHYAKRIQTAILPPQDKLKKLLPDSFIYYRPRDIVSGDFYWVNKVVTEGGRELIVFAAADCTGHGVPGAFMSIIGYNLLELSRKTPHVNTPAEALDFLNEGVNRTFNQAVGGSTVRDGMDIVICAIDFSTGDLFYAGAKNPIYVIRKAVDNPETEPALTENGYDLFQYKGDKQAIGRTRDTSKIIPFTNNHIKLQENDVIYAFSDGFPDQFGGENGKKYMYKPFKQLLIRLQHYPMADQEAKMDTAFNEWINYADPANSFEQIDDVLVIGIRYTQHTKKQG